MNLYFSLRIVFFEFNLRLVFLAHINLRLDAGATDNGGRSKLSVQGIFCFVQLFRFLTSFIREQGELGDFLTGDIGKCNAQQPKDNEADWDNFYTQYPQPQQAEVMPSWNRIFDLDHYAPNWDPEPDRKSIQATLWKVEISQVKKVEHFLAK